MRELTWHTKDEHEAIDASRIMASIIGDATLIMRAGGDTNDMVEQFEISPEFLDMVIQATWDLGTHGMIPSSIYNRVTRETYKAIFAAGFVTAKEYAERYDSDPFFCALKQA